MKNERVQILGRVPLFSVCTKKELSRIASLTSEIDRPEGTVIVRQGEPGQECYVIAEGTAGVSIDRERIASLGSGDCSASCRSSTWGPAWPRSPQRRRSASSCSTRASSGRSWRRSPRSAARS